MELSREDLDREFPSRRHGIQFNHAAVCPLPARAVEAIRGYADRLASRGPLDWKEWGAEADALRAAAARLIGADDAAGGARSVSVVPNTTWGLNLVAQGLGLGAGDSVVTTASEFPANLTPWLALERDGVRVRRLPTRDGAFTADELAAACDATTKLVSISLVSFHTGFRAPVETIAAFCRPRGIVFGLDAIQGVGAIPVDVAGWGVDFLSADGHKWMLGPEGCGILFTRPEFRGRLRAPAGWTNLKRDFGGDFRVPDAPEFVADATKFEVGALPTRDGAFTAEELAEACDATTKLVSISLVSFHTGFRAPVEAIASFCRSRGIVFGLDAIQGVGAIPVDVASWGIDFLSADGHKWMLGPEGCGILYTHPLLRERLTPPAGWTNLKRDFGGDFRVPDVPAFVSDATKFEVGALPTPGVYTLRASVELLLSLGLDLIGRRIVRTLAVLVDGLPRLGFSPVLFGGPPHAGILAARPPAGKDARYYAKRLADANIAVSAREGFLRLSPHVGNDEEEAARVIDALGTP